jgi:hypothetical protein
MVSVNEYWIWQGYHPYGQFSDTRKVAPVAILPLYHFSKRKHPSWQYWDCNWHTYLCPQSHENNKKYLWQKKKMC